jgi:hypothetical protein
MGGRILRTAHFLYCFDKCETRVTQSEVLGSNHKIFVISKQFMVDDQ